MASTYAIVYATATKSMRRTIASDHGQVHLGTMPGSATRKAVVVLNEDGTQSYFALDPNETAILANVPPAAHAPANHYDWLNEIQTQTGVTPGLGRCALLDPNNIVTDVIQADTSVDKSPDSRTMIDCYSASIGQGCTYDPASGLFSLPAHTLPPGVPGNPTDQPIDVPPQVIPKP